MIVTVFICFHSSDGVASPAPGLLPPQHPSTPDPIDIPGKVLHYYILLTLMCIVISVILMLFI